MVRTADKKLKLLNACKHLDRYLDKRYGAGLSLIFLSTCQSGNQVSDALRFQLEKRLRSVDMNGAKALMEKAQKGIRRANKYQQFLEAYQKKYDICAIEEQVIYFKGHQLVFPLGETALDLTRFERLSLGLHKQKILQWSLSLKEKHNMRLYQVLDSLEPSYIPIAETVLLDLARKADWIIPRIDGNAICLDFQKGENMRSPISSNTVICCIQNEGVAK